MKEIIEIYKKEIEIFLGTMNIRKCAKIDNKIDERIYNENKKVIKTKMIQQNSGNINEQALEQAIDELLPYMKQF